MTRRWVRRPEGSTWGDFGDDDQLGRMNLLTPERRLAALRTVTHGIAFTLSLPLDYPGGNVLFRYRKPPRLVYERRASGGNYTFNYCPTEISPRFTDVISDDAVLLYTQYSTQWDSLAHVGQLFDADDDGVPEKVYYNGYRAGLEILGPEEAPEAPGARALGVENMAAAGLQGRGVLVDLEARHGREPHLVGRDELVRALDEQGVEVRTGDFLCLYTGFADVILAMNKQPERGMTSRYCAALDGRDDRLLQWITDSGIVAVCADNFGVEGYPSAPGQGERYPALPLHAHCLFKLGVNLGELWYFTELARWLRGNGRWTFLLTAPPLRLPGAVGSPVTPIATV